MTRYALTPLVAPAAAVVSLAEVKAQCRIDFADEDALLSNYIAAATGWLDGEGGYLGRALITQDWTLRLDCFKPSIMLPLPPCQEVLEVRYVDLAGVTQTLDPAEYAVSGLGAAGGARLRPAGGLSWPPTIREPECVEIDFRAGYGDAPGDVPDPIRQAIITRAAQLYEHRETPPDPPIDMVQGFREFAF